MTFPAQLPLINTPIVGVDEIDLSFANELLVRWQHKLGACRRPFRSEAYALSIDSRIIGVAISASTVSKRVTWRDVVDGPCTTYYRRTEVVELARLCAAPGIAWANRVLVRIWREVLAPKWACWAVKAAVSYSHNALHAGSLYRHDGWTSMRDDCGSSGGGQWSATRDSGDAVAGKKTLWVWKYAT